MLTHLTLNKEKNVLPEACKSISFVCSLHMDPEERIFLIILKLLRLSLHQQMSANSKYVQYSADAPFAVQLSKMNLADELQAFWRLNNSLLQNKKFVGKKSKDTD